jgi:hypothetical protein
MGSLALAGEASQTPTVQDVVRQMDERGKARTALLDHYTCLRRYVVNNLRFHQVAELKVRMSCSSSGHKTFEVVFENGLSVIRKKVLRRMLEAEEEASRDDIRTQTQIASQNYNFRLLMCWRQRPKPSANFCCEGGFGWMATISRSCG